MQRNLAVEAGLGPFQKELSDQPTFPRLICRAAELRADRVALRQKIEGIWQHTSWSELLTITREVAMGLAALGMKPADVGSILGNTNRDWLFADLGLLCAGCVSSGIYPTDAPPQVQFLLADSASHVLFVENEEQLDKVLAVRSELTYLKHIVVFDTKGLRGFDDPTVITFAELRRRGAAYYAADPSQWERCLASRSSDDLAILIYTSGTTGKPKGAMLSHRNIISMFAPFVERLLLREHDERLCYLPMCHVAERITGVFCSLYAGAVANFIENPTTQFENLREVSPHVFLAVPRIWEKLYSSVTLRIDDGTAFERFVYNRSLAFALRVTKAQLEGHPVSMLDRLLVRLVRRTVFKNIRTWMGLDRCRTGFSAAAPIAADLMIWYRALGVSMIEGYGMTETSGVVAMGQVDTFRPGTVGTVVRGVEVAIGRDGEILVRSPGNVLGYVNLPDVTAETISADGWLRTGDVGELDDRGYLRITDRLKDIIVNSAGKNISPSELENQLKLSPYINDAVAIGDRRKYVTCLVMIDQENVEKFAQDRSIPFSNFASLCSVQEVHDLIWSEIETVNRRFARVEQIKKFRLITTLLTAEDEEMTPTMKLKRRVIADKYKTLIEEMYADEEKAA
ncbi:AMP-dependent synthetase/ligase [Pseudorhodoplanes sp.]|uniref:AMP-dependent synthetase/ligase n=1 Tax=Pseudorhodoplanes sp. TaxID=1934341 RepID=UPI003D10EDDD